MNARFAAGTRTSRPACFRDVPVSVNGKVRAHRHLEESGRCPAGGQELADLRTRMGAVL